MLNKIVIIEKIDKNSFDNLELYLNSINDDPLNNYIQKGCERVCPLSGNNLKQIFGIYVNKYHANIYSFFKNSELKDEIKMSNIFTEIMYAGQTIGFYEPNKNIFYKFDNAPKGESDSRMIEVINEVIKETEIYIFKKNSFEDFKPLLFLGDSRPLHFVGDLVGYFYIKIPLIKSLIRKIKIIETKNLSFFNLGILFSPYFDSRTIHHSQINNYCRDNNFLLLNGMRPNEGKENNKKSLVFEWCLKKLKKNIANNSKVFVKSKYKLPKKAFIVVISLDIEKERFTNQYEFTIQVINQLLDYTQSINKKLVIVWDGWTIRSQGITKSDKNILSRIKKYSSKFESRWNKNIVFKKIYDLEMTEKILFCKDIDFFISTYGTAAMVPGAICMKPGFCYHNPKELKKKLPITLKNAYILPNRHSRFINEDKSKAYHKWPYSIELSAIPSIPKILTKNKKLIFKNIYQKIPIFKILNKKIIKNAYQIIIFKRFKKLFINNIIEEDIKFTKNSVKFYIKNKYVLSFYFVNRNKKEINYIPINYDGLWTIAEIDIRKIDESGYTDFFYQIGKTKIKFGNKIKKNIKTEEDRILHIFKNIKKINSNEFNDQDHISLFFQITYTRKSISCTFKIDADSLSFINKINYAKATKLSKKGNILKLYGVAFVSGINSTDIANGRILVVGRQYFDEYYFPLKFKKKTQITKKYGFNTYNYDYSGFECEFNFEDLIKKSSINSHWDFFIELTDNKGNIYIKKLSGLPLNKEGDEVIVFKKISKNIEYLLYFTYRHLNLAITQRDITAYETYLHKFKEFLAVIIHKSRLIRNFDESVLIGEYLSERAQDNGFYFFKYLCEKHPEIKCHYVIKKNSPDIKNLAKYSKKLVYYFSFKHLLLLLSCKAIISSQGREHLYLFKPKKGIFKNAILKKPFIFLQHGVIGFKKIGGFRKGGINTAKYIVASNKVEKKIIKDNFFYKEEEIILTGLPRYDVLLDKSSQSNSILIMPTWRSWLFSLKDDDFLLSDFYKSYNSLLKNKKLIDFTVENNIELIFFGHMKIFKFMQLFESQNLKLIKPGEKNINHLLMKSKVLVTDYSSVAWDFYYMKKPVCFYHFDQDKFLETHGSYLDLNKEIFGTVIKTEDKLVDKIIESYFNKNNKNIEKEFFEYNDKRNSERIFKNIKDYLGWY